MKRRLVLRETPIKTKKKGKVVTVQRGEHPDPEHVPG